MLFLVPAFTSCGFQVASHLTYLYIYIYVSSRVVMEPMVLEEFQERRGQR